jgi:mono/diheme cytochrome c family protein
MNTINLKSAASALALALAAGTLGCSQEDIDPMIKQAKYKAYAPNPFFADGRGMRQPVAGTVAREQTLGSTQLVHGVDEKGEMITNFPLPVTAQLVEKGRAKYDIHCAICHGHAGDGISLVASQMSLKPPPSLHLKRAVTNGHLYKTIAEGFGLMGSYAAELSVEERWAVVAYVRALQRSQFAKLDDATPEARTVLAAQAPAPAAPAEPHDAHPAKEHQ